MENAFKGITQNHKECFMPWCNANLMIPVPLLQFFAQVRMKLLYVELVGELRSLDIEDLTVDADFHKIDSLASRLENLASNTTEDELVTYAINGLSNKCDHVAHLILNRVPFSNPEEVRSMLSLDETHMNRRNQSSSSSQISSSSPNALVAQSSSTRFQALDIKDMEDAGWNMDTIEMRLYISILIANNLSSEFNSIDEDRFPDGNIFRETLAEGEKANVKMLFKGSGITKEDCESQLYDDFELLAILSSQNGEIEIQFVNKHFRKWGRFVTTEKLNRGLRNAQLRSTEFLSKAAQDTCHNQNDVRTDSLNTVDPLPLALMNKATVQDGRVVVQNVQGRQNRGQGNNARGAGTAGYGATLQGTTLSPRNHRTSNTSKTRWFTEAKNARSGKGALDGRTVTKILAGGHDNERR
ncbi:hypothetical protein Tco_0604384 [Tanacetum coccineum]